MQIRPLSDFHEKNRGRGISRKNSRRTKNITLRPPMSHTRKKRLPTRTLSLPPLSNLIYSPWGDHTLNKKNCISGGTFGMPSSLDSRRIVMKLIKHSSLLSVVVSLWNHSYIFWILSAFGITSHGLRFTVIAHDVDSTTMSVGSYTTRRYTYGQKFRTVFWALKRRSQEKRTQIRFRIATLLNNWRNAHYVSVA